MPRRLLPRRLHSSPAGALLLAAALCALLSRSRLTRASPRFCLHQIQGGAGAAVLAGATGHPRRGRARHRHKRVVPRRRGAAAATRAGTTGCASGEAARCTAARAEICCACRRARQSERLQRQGGRHSDHHRAFWVRACPSRFCCIASRALLATMPQAVCDQRSRISHSFSPPVQAGLAGAAEHVQRQAVL